jgi:ankyrin repeat protein
MYACKAGSKEAVDMLLALKADIKAVNNLGDTCVNLAQKSGNSEVMMLLVKNGASIRPASRSRLPSAGGAGSSLLMSKQNLL